MRSTKFIDGEITTADLPNLRMQRRCNDPEAGEIPIRSHPVRPGLRTSAAHARWEEIDLGDVAPVIELTKELIGAHLA